MAAGEFTKLLRTGVVLAIGIVASGAGEAERRGTMLGNMAADFPSSTGAKAFALNENRRVDYRFQLYDDGRKDCVISGVYFPRSDGTARHEDMIQSCDEWDDPWKRD